MIWTKKVNPILTTVKVIFPTRTSLIQTVEMKMIALTILTLVSVLMLGKAHRVSVYLMIPSVSKYKYIKDYVIVG